MRILHDHVHVQVPATTANLGPGFDSFGLALNLVDDIKAQAIAGPTTIEVEGYGANTLPRDDSHLIVRALHMGLDAVGASQVGVHLQCTNRIPHGRGLGSSAAAIVAGLMIARGLIQDPDALNDERIVQLGTRMEGHGDNIAPAVYGGATLVWTDNAELFDDAYTHTVQLPHDKVSQVTVCIPQEELLTSTARSVLPDKIAHDRAAANSARAGLLIYALNHDDDLLYPGTEDRLHQDFRRESMPASLDLIDYLRSHGLPAVVSGAGPTVMVMKVVPSGIRKAIEEAGWDVRILPIHHDGANIIT
ncbi:MAG: homoserine kinase [Actinomycetaceae bacterium]|nr:homoserine kinase [Actinomycetaceae bacterium]